MPGAAKRRCMLEDHLQSQRVAQGVPGAQRVAQGLPGAQREAQGHPGAQREAQGLPGAQHVAQGLPGAQVPQAVQEDTPSSSATSSVPFCSSTPSSSFPCPYHSSPYPSSSSFYPSPSPYPSSFYPSPSPYPSSSFYPFSSPYPSSPYPYPSSYSFYPSSSPYPYPSSYSFYPSSSSLSPSPSPSSHYHSSFFYPSSSSSSYPYPSSSSSSTSSFFSSPSSMTPSFSTPYPSSSASPMPFSFSSSSSCSTVVPNTPSALEDVCAAAGTQSAPQSPPCACHFPTAAASVPLSQSSSQGAEGPSSLQALPGTVLLPRYVMDGKVGDLVLFLLLKYRAKEPTTKAEMLSIVIREYQEHFPEIFSRASECLQLVFGVDVKAVDPSNPFFVLDTTLDLTYDGMGSEKRSLPKTGLLILTLSIIFLRGDCVPEEDIWEKLSRIELYVGREHYIYGEPRELLTRIWVRERYLEYRQVPNSSPARYEFLWGPRAHAETSKMKVLEYLAKMNGHDPRSFSDLYEKALRDQRESPGQNYPPDNTIDRASASSSGVSGGFSHPD